MNTVRFVRDRNSHYGWNTITTSGDVILHVLPFKGVTFEMVIIERYHLRESSVEEAIIEMYLGSVSIRQVKDITEAL